MPLYMRTYDCTASFYEGLLPMGLFDTRNAESRLLCMVPLQIWRESCTPQPIVWFDRDYLMRLDLSFRVACSPRGLPSNTRIYGQLQANQCTAAYNYPDCVDSWTKRIR